MSEAKKLYVLYDERANVDEDDALVLSTADSIAEARAEKRDLFPDAVIFEYDECDGVAKNGRRVE